MVCLCNNRKTRLTAAYTQSPLLILQQMIFILLQLPQKKLDQKNIFTFVFKIARWPSFHYHQDKNEKIKKNYILEFILQLSNELVEFRWRNFDMQMVKCDVCLEWFHRKFERIPDIAFSPNVNWECTNVSRYLKLL